MIVKFKDLNSGEVTEIKASTLQEAFNQACNRFGTEYVCDCMQMVGPDPMARLREPTSEAKPSQEKQKEQEEMNSLSTG